MRISIFCCRVALAAFMSAALLPTLALAQSDQKDAAKAAAQRLSGENWIIEEETLGSGSRLLPDVRSFLGRLRARGGFPYHKLLLGARGTELVRTRGREFAARAAAKQIHVRIDGESIECTSSEGRFGLGMRKTLGVLLKRFKPKARDAGSALAASTATVTVLTIKGRLEEARVRPHGSGWEVDLTWKQGSRWWEFHEVALWSLRFDGSGALVSIRKSQKDHTRRLLR